MKKKSFLIMEIVLSAIVLVTCIVLILLVLKTGREELQNEEQQRPAIENTVTLPPPIDENTEETSGKPQADISIDASTIVKDPEPEVVDTKIEYVTKEEVYE